MPDLDINTQGRDLAEAIYMARNAIGLWGICEQDDERVIHPPTALQEVKKETEADIITLVDIDFDDYR